MYRKVLERFPNGIIYAFAYGSGVKKQLGYDVTRKSPMIDFVFCVEDPLQWHSENIKRNINDYSTVKYLGPSFITRYQQNFGAKIFFNTLVPISDQGIIIKYGVVTKPDLIDDLQNWNHLYIAGRLHKPINEIQSSNAVELKQSIAQNLTNALRTSLLLLPSNFSDFELYHTIANLSYGGDFRMKFGENKQKVQNIVEPQIEEFYNLYLPALRELSDYVAILSNRKGYQQEKSPEATQNHIRNLPRELLNRIFLNSGVPESTKAFGRIVKDSNLNKIVLKSVNQIVFRSSVKQSIKNIPTAGIGKSLEYSLSKISKMFRSS